MWQSVRSPPRSNPRAVNLGSRRTCVVFARFRELSQRRDQADMLKSTWAKQDQLKKLELEIEKGL